ncbi:MAG: hypothetical protein LUE16_02710 [Lachnospiraceae bacterium]|nr:hypothetical protein [Lachnospiraceae bacterium]
MEFFEEMKTLGMDVEEGLDRMVGNAALYERMLAKFADMLDETPVTDDFHDGDCEEVTRCIHALKGAAGNLSIRPLYDAYTEIVNLLRAGEISQAKNEIRRILPTQERIVECIRRHGQEGQAE